MKKACREGRQEDSVKFAADAASEVSALLT